jgi:putative ABC transport system ATP-binding protein
LDPDQGLVIVDGKNLVSPDKSPLRIRNNIGYSFQEPLLIPYLSALENVMIANPRENPRKESEAAELLSQLGLSDRLAHSPSNLSTGEKKRVDLARALFQKPKILVADEPLLGLDPKAIDLTVNMLRDYCTTETSVLYSASDPNHASFATAIFEL